MTTHLPILAPRLWRAGDLDRPPTSRLPISRTARHTILGFIRTATLALLLSGTALAQTVDPNFWVTNDVVRQVARLGNTIYLAGDFTQVGPASGGGIPLDAASGALPPLFPKVSGDVRAVIPDGAGGWYIGGSFTAVGGLPRSNLAHVLSNLTVSPWNPGATLEFSPAGEVRALASLGSVVYVGGFFTRVGGLPRSYLAAVNTTTGLTTAWNPSPDYTVDALAASNSSVYVGGGFHAIGGQSRNGAAALYATTGVATTWNPQARVAVFLTSGSLVYAGGDFTIFDGQPRNRIACFDPGTGAITSWNPNANGAVSSLAVSGSTVYVGGRFTTIGGQPRNRIAALDATSGMATGWDPNAGGVISGLNPDVRALAASGSVVYAAGRFTSIGGQSRNLLAALDATTGAALAWNPNLALTINSMGVNALALTGTTLYVGGVFRCIGGVARPGLAALDATTGAATAWDPAPNNSVTLLKVIGSTLYVGGPFTSIGGQPRNFVAAFDASGLLTAWNPAPNDRVFDIDGSGSTLYVGGNFANIGGQARTRIAALDATTGLATAWNPSANGAVELLVDRGSIVYAGGDFTSIGGQARTRIAALDATTGLATAWNPAPSSNVFALGVIGSTVYVGGGFTSIGGTGRYALAALDDVSGMATGWYPNPFYGGEMPPLPAVYTLAVSGSIIYVGGSFGNIGNANRSCIAALDAATASATPWNPGAPGSVYTLKMSGSTVYVGGAFSFIGNQPQSYFAAISSDIPTPTLLSILSAQVRPEGVELIWVAPARDVTSATVQRCAEREEWQAVGVVPSDSDGRLVFCDARVLPGHRYGYRLAVVDAGQEVFRGEAWVDVPTTPVLALSGLLSESSDGGLRVTISLPDGSPASLALFDIGGRKIVSREVGTLGAGSHIVPLEVRGLSPGIYLLRLARGDRAVRARAVVLR